MRKFFILSGIAMLCLFVQTNSSSAAATVKNVPSKHVKAKKGKLFFIGSGSYYNSNSFAITLEFWQFGHPATVVNIPVGYSSGTYSVPDGTYDVVLRGPSPAYYEVTGRTSQQTSVATFSGMTFNSSTSITFTCDLPQ